jgi:hypothetical protein
VLPDATMVSINFLEEKVLKEKVPKTDEHLGGCPLFTQNN